MITLSFQRSGIDVTLWLAGEAWNRATDLAEKLEARVAELNHAVIAAERRAAA
jgi:hypothetical protein